MDDALRVDDHFDALHFHTEEPAGLDHFQPFVEERGGVDGDFGAHAPGGMFERLGRSNTFKGSCRGVAERAAAGGEEEAANMGRIAPFQALKDGVMFAVHREDVDPFAPGGFHDDLARHDEDLLAGDGEILPCFDGGQGGAQPANAHDGDENHVRLRQRG